MKKLHRSYLFKDKDPIIDQLRTLVQDEGLTYSEVAEAAGITVQTLYNWFTGPTKRPQYATVMCVVRGMGYDLLITRSNSVRSAKVIPLKRRKA